MATLLLSPSGRRWRRLIDTALPSPNDLVAEDAGPEVSPGPSTRWRRIRW